MILYLDKAVCNISFEWENIHSAVQGSLVAFVVSMSTYQHAFGYSISDATCISVQQYSTNAAYKSFVTGTTTLLKLIICHRWKCSMRSTSQPTTLVGWPTCTPLPTSKCSLLLKIGESSKACLFVCVFRTRMLCSLCICFSICVGGVSCNLIRHSSFLW